jgi:signal transduction histidine kinase/CheY-like chemotaxis protein
MNQESVCMEDRALITERARRIFAEELLKIRRGTDRVFAALLSLQWVAAVATALWVSPYTWSGAESRLHPHVWAAVGLGVLCTLVPLTLMWKQPGSELTRQVIAVSQVSWSALLIHLTGGRIETHFHIFGSLAFLAWYMDVRVLVTATALTIADHLARGFYWPQSVFGSASASNWRAIEHGGWVLFEDVFLVIWIHFGLRTLWSNALQQARLRHTNHLIETKVRDRTGELQAYANEMEAAQHTLREQARVLSSQAADLKRANQEAEQANRAKSEFLANMSHEIRTPMTAILGFADVLAETLREPEQLDAITTIKRNGAYLLELVNDILDLSKIEAGKLQLERIRCQTLSVIADVASLMRVRAASKGLPLDVEYVGPIPETIETDPTRLRQILINLIGNAIKFTEVGRVRLIVTMRREPQPRLCIDVVDTGLGMTDAQVARLFTPFTQADASTTRRFGGTGLGLSISKRFAEMLDGELTVDSKLGAGSTFHLQVAAGALEGVPMLSGPFEASSSRARPSTEREVQIVGHILLAEDGPDNQRLISFVLKHAGAEVTVADNGQMAVDLALATLAEGKPFDCVLMDMQMPILDGYEATRRLRAAGYEAPIVALTAHAMAGDDAKCLAAGCNDYTTKPIQRQRLINMVAQYCAPPVASS